MRRLLAYLFIVLGLGIMFNTNSFGYQVYEGLELANYLNSHKINKVCI